MWSTIVVVIAAIFFSFSTPIIYNNLVYCLNNIYYGYWNKIQFICNTQTICYVWIEKRENKNREAHNAWTFLSNVASIFFVSMICFAVFNGTSFHSLSLTKKNANYIFFSLFKFHNSRIQSTHICSVLFTNIVRLILLFISCFTKMKIKSNCYSIHSTRNCSFIHDFAMLWPFVERVCCL